MKNLQQRDQPKRSDLIAFHLMMPVLISAAVSLIWFMSQLPPMHSPLLTRILVAGIVIIAGLTWWIAVAVRPQLLLVDPSDRLINTVGGLEMALLFWLVVPPVPALIMTMVLITWLVLLRVFPWFPQYRSKRSRSMSK